MQNKPNLRNEKMNITYYTKTNYKQKRLSGQQKNKPNQTQFLPSEALAKDGQTPRPGRPFLLLGVGGAGIIASMRIPLTKYGWPQVVTFPAMIIAIMAVCLLAPLPVWVLCWLEAIFAVVLIWIFSFFRDPKRTIPQDKNLLLSPADGTVTDIETIAENDFIGAPAVRIGVFLSVFDVHINRAPCGVKVEKIIYKKGKFKDARDAQAGRVNESNDLYLVRTEGPADKLIVRQISGAIARRIVCEAKEGQNLTGGQKFGMIKFGSRTELYIPAGDNVKCLVRVGDKVKAGLTPLVKYEM